MQKCNNENLESGFCNKSKTFIVNRDFSILSKNLPFQRLTKTEIDHSIISSNIKISEKTFPENDSA